MIIEPTAVANVISLEVFGRVYDEGEFPLGQCKESMTKCEVIFGEWKTILCILSSSLSLAREENHFQD